MAIGTYIVVFRLQKQVEIDVGRLGPFLFPRGYYLYVGSAFGPGGLNARIGRHLRGIKRLHWHIDYLASNENIVDVWYSNQTKKHECGWAAILEEVPELQCPAPGFGSTDCSCNSHLFCSRKKPQFPRYRDLIRGGITRWNLNISKTQKVEG